MCAHSGKLISAKQKQKHKKQLTFSTQAKTVLHSTQILNVETLKDIEKAYEIYFFLRICNLNYKNTIQCFNIKGT